MAARTRTRTRSSRKQPAKTRGARSASRGRAGQATGGRASARSGRGAGGGLSQKVQPDEALAAVIGKTAMPRTQVVRKFWDYVKSHNLQARNDRRKINADERLRPLFGGKRQIDMFEVTRVLVRHAR
jgi:chromatin remodeling complex protein RSC6